MMARGVKALSQRDDDLDPYVWAQLLDGKGGLKPRVVNPKDSPLPQDPFTNFRHERLKKRVDRHGHITGEKAIFDIPMANRRETVWDADKLKEFLCRSGLPENEAFAEAVAAIGDWKMSFEQAVTALRLNPYTAEARKELEKITRDDPLRDVRRLLIRCPKGRDRRILRRLICEASVTRFVNLDEHEIGIDLDALYETAAATASAWRLAERIVEDVFVANCVRVFVETSRSRTGVYIRFRVKRSSDAATFNLLLGRLDQHLKTFVDPEGLSRVCKVSRLAWWEKNSAFDENLYNDTPVFSDDDDFTDYLGRSTFGESYEFKKSVADIDRGRLGVIPWRYDLELERHLLIGCDLLTTPLHGLSADQDGGAGRLEKFMSFRNDPASIVSEDYVRAMLPTVDDDVITKIIEHVPADAAPARLGTSRDTSILFDDSIAQHSRYVAAARIETRRHAGNEAAATAATLDLVETEDGPATGARHPERANHCARAVRYALRTYNKSKHRSDHHGPDYIPRWNESHINWAKNRMKQRLSKPLADVNISAVTAATAFLTYIDAIDQHPDGHVGRDTLVKFGGVTKSEAATLFKLFTTDSAELLVMTHRHSKGWHPRAFCLHQRCPVPAFLDADKVKRHIPFEPKAEDSTGWSEHDEEAWQYLQAESGIVETAQAEVDEVVCKDFGNLENLYIGVSMVGAGSIYPDNMSLCWPRPTQLVQRPQPSNSAKNDYFPTICRPSA